MALTHTLQWDDDEPPENVLIDINCILKSEWTGFTSQRAWTQLVIDGLCLCGFTDGPTDDDEPFISVKSLQGKWPEAFEILRRHVEAAALEIKTLSLSETKPQ